MQPADFTTALQETATALEQRMLAVYRLTAGEIERALLAHNAVVVNFLRRTRGMAELVAPQQPTSGNKTLGDGAAQQGAEANKP